jgi:hypothetical protein
MGTTTRKHYRQQSRGKTTMVMITRVAMNISMNDRFMKRL